MSALGSGAEIFDINPYASSTVQQHQLGTFGFDRGGRSYRYVKNGAVLLVAGNLLQSEARDTAFTSMVVVSGAAGQKEIVVTLGATATVANQFDGGTLAISVTPGMGQSFTIKSHTVAAGAVSCTFTVEENIVTALTTSSRVTVSTNLYSGVIVSPTTRTGKTVGVAHFAIPAGTAAIPQYGWIGVRGVFAVLSDATVAAVGEGLSPSTTTAGSVTKQVTLLENIGTAHILGVSAATQPAFITIN
jgi:hypothetical protein